jgi:short-subunit dehydrogenase
MQIAPENRRDVTALNLHSHRGMNLRRLGLGILAAYAGARYLVRRKRRISFAGKTVFITGGSRGLGLVIARQLAKERAKLVLLARDPDELQRAEQDLILLGAEVLSITADVTDIAQIDLAVKEANLRFGGIDVLINNAGTMQVGPLEHATIDDFERAMNVNFWGALHTVAAIAPQMKTRGAGRIVNIASIGGQIAVPHMMPYTASKFALVGFSESLRAELSKNNILVTTVCPSLVRTGSPRHVEFKGRAEAEYSWFVVADSLPGLSISAEKAAARIIDACRHGVASCFVSPIGRIAAILSRVAPELTADVCSLVNRAMPSHDEHARSGSRKGFELNAPVNGTILTKLTHAAAVENNEL